MACLNETQCSQQSICANQYSCHATADTMVISSRKGEGPDWLNLLYPSNSIAKPVEELHVSSRLQALQEVTTAESENLRTVLVPHSVCSCSFLPYSWAADLARFHRLPAVPGSMVTPPSFANCK